jgi:signal transduction histidine kinase
MGGTGLGTSIVKSIVEAHRGTVSFTSVPKKGTTFRLCLPLVD